MGYQALIETLLREGESKSRAVLEKARAESEAILREAKEKAGRLEQESRAGLEKELQARRVRILNRARIECRGLLLRAKHEVMERVFEKSREQLRGWAGRAGREKSHRRRLTRLVELSLPERQTAGLRAVLGEESSDLLEPILREKGVVCERVKDPDLWFGFRLTTADGRLVVTNSYAARLEKVKPALLVELSNLLFG